MLPERRRPLQFEVFDNCWPTIPGRCPSGGASNSFALLRFLPDSSPRCPGCGAPASAESARCAYCGSVLATVTCPSCFAPMFAGSRFCARCGAEATRETIADAPPLTCPRCAGTLQAVRLGSTPARECADCGGLWVDPATLQLLCDAREDHAGILSVLATHEPAKPTVPETVRYIPCPRCKKLMNRVNFAHSSGVVLDVCKSHGVWLDRGELQRVVGFVEQGGLSAARERERQQLEDERRRLELAKAGSTAPGPEAPGLSISFTRRTSTHDSSIDLLLRDALGLFIGS